MLVLTGRSGSATAPAHRYQPDSNKGDEKEREAVLGENDSLWVELRHKFIAEVYTTLAARFNEFQSKNRAAKQLGGGRWAACIVILLCWPIWATMLILPIKAVLYPILCARSSGTQSA